MERLVLVVDDSPEDCGAVRRYLGQDAGAAYRVIEQHTPDAGAAACRESPPDCLILDYDLPGVDGLDFLDRITPPDTPPPFAVVMLTGRGNERIAVSALKRGIQDYLVKGQYTADVLRQTVRDAIAKVDLRSELDRQRREVERLGAEAARRAEELADRDRRKDEFLAVLAHELRNPLAPIRNGLALLRAQYPGPGPGGQTVAMMDRQLTHLVRLVDDLLDVSRVARGKVELRRRPVALADVIDQAVEAARPRLTEGRHRLDVALPPDPPALDADPDRLAQVFGNLLANAAKYTEPGGTVRLSAAAQDGHVTVRVKDSGIGIRPEMLGEIFELFTQADRTTGRAADGLGVGLALVRGLVEMHGGSVVAHSDGPGTGSEFAVRLPVLRPAARPATEPAGPDGGPPGRPLRVLIVDDNVDGASSLADLLQLGSGHDVRVEHDGPAGLKAAAAYRPEVVLLDIGLPYGMDGYEVARRLREADGEDTPTLIALTGYGQDRDRLRSIEAGFSAHLIKPVDLTLLNELLTQIPPRQPSSG